MPTLNTLSLAEYQSLPLLERTLRVPDTYLRPLNIRGNSLLSSVYVLAMDPGASLEVTYWDTTTGNKDTGERFTLDRHEVITPDMLVPGRGYTSRKTIARIHDKPNLEAVVTGGSVTFGVYATVVNSFATDMDQALQGDGDPVDLVAHQGLPIVIYDDVAQVWRFMRSTNGRLQVDVPGVLQATQQAITERLHGHTTAALPGVEQIHVNFTVPSGKRFRWLTGHGCSSTWALWHVQVDGVRYLTDRSSFERPRVNLSLEAPLILTAGQVLQVLASNLNPYGETAEIESFLYGVLEDA